MLATQSYHSRQATFTGGTANFLRTGFATLFEVAGLIVALAMFISKEAWEFISNDSNSEQKRVWYGRIRKDSK